MDKIIWHFINFRIIRIIIFILIIQGLYITTIINYLYVW